MTFLLRSIAFGSVLLTLIAIYPGLWDDVVFTCILLLLCFSILILIIIIGSVIASHFIARLTVTEPEHSGVLTADKVGAAKRSASQWRKAACSFAVIFLSFTLILVDAPKRLAFRLSRPAFQHHLTTAPSPTNEDGMILDRWLGVYHVDCCRTDARGGVYFRTYAGGDGLGPDTTSYGFAFKPNQQGSPFGRAAYHYSQIIGDWYVFSASNDY